MNGTSGISATQVMNKVKEHARYAYESLASATKEPALWDVHCGSAEERVMCMRALATLLQTYLPDESEEAFQMLRRAAEDVRGFRESRPKPAARPWWRILGRE